jgi:hypothetical protein
MNRSFGFVPPYRLLIIHTVLILFFMFALAQRWFLKDIPFDCFYTPFLITSGPIVYFIAHYAQHFSERFFAHNNILFAWNLVPGIVCLILGGLQWLAIESFIMHIRKKRKALKVA